MPAPVVTPNEVPSVSLPSPLPPAPTVRERYTEGEPDRLTKLRETIDYERNAQLEKVGRGRAFLALTLRGIGDAVTQAQAAAAATGRPVGWGDIAGGLGAGLSAGIAGAVSPSILARERRDATVSDLQGQLSEEMRARAAAAQLDDLESRPFIKAAELRQKQLESQQESGERERDQIIRFYNDLPEFDPDSEDPTVRLLVSRAAAVGIPLLKKERNQPAGSLEYDGDGRLIIVRNGTATPVLDPSGQPVVNDSKRLVEYRGFRVPQTVAATASAQSERFDREQANRLEDRQFSDQRYYSEQERRSVERQQDNYRQERERADAFAKDFERAKTEAVSLDAQMRQAQAITADSSMPADVRAQARINAETFRIQRDAPFGAARGLQSALQGSYGRHYEVGADAQGNPYVKPLRPAEFKPVAVPPPPRRAAPRSGGQYTEAQVRERARAAGVAEADAVRAARERGLIRTAGGAYAGSVMRRANLAAAARRLGVRSEAEAERIFTANGGVVID